MNGNVFLFLSKSFLSSRSKSWTPHDSRNLAPQDESLKTNGLGCTSTPDAFNETDFSVQMMPHDRDQHDYRNRLADYNGVMGNAVGRR